MKKSQILMIVLIFSLAIVAAYTYSDQNSTGSLLGITDTTLDESEEVVYHVVAFTQDLNPTETIITKKVTNEIDGSTTNSDGQEVEGSLTADFILEVDSLGWEHDVIKQTSPNYVNHLEDTVTGWLPSWNDGFVSLDHTYANGFTYYQMSDESWRIHSNYEPKVIIDGKTYTAGMRTYGKDTSGTRIEIQGDSDKPSIYYEEVMFTYSSQSTTEPQLGNIEIVPYGGTMMFTDYNDKSIKNIVNDWNRVMAGQDGLFTDGEDTFDHRESLDMNGDKEADTDNMDEDFSLEEFVTNDWQYEAATAPSTWKSVPNPIDYEYTTSSGNAVHYDQYDLVTGGDAKLIYNTPMMVVGTWHIPVEYGDVKVIESNPVPEIISFGMVGDLTDNQGTASYNVKVKCASGEGRISVQLIQNEEKSIPLIIEPDSIQSETFETGEEIEFTFKLIGDDVNGNVENEISVVATGSGGAQDIKKDTIGIIDLDGYDEADMVSISVSAISIVDSDPLTTHPVIINGETKYGTWTGKVIPNINIEVTGKDFEGYSPQPSQTIKATADGDSFTFKYQPSTGGNGNGTNWWLFGAIGAVILILLIGSTYFLVSDKKGNKK